MILFLWVFLSLVVFSGVCLFPCLFCLFVYFVCVVCWVLLWIFVVAF